MSSAGFSLVKKTTQSLFSVHFLPDLNHDCDFTRSVDDTI